MSARNYSTLFLLTLMLVAFTYCQREPEMTKEEYVQHIVSQVRSDSLKSYVRWLESMGTRFALADNHREVAVSIKKRFAGFGYTDVKLDSFYLTKTYREITYSTWQYNVVASTAGTEDDSVTIVGAHYDDAVSTGDPFTFAPGANDNASGVAAVLEIARVMRKNNFQPQHTIMFTAYAAEELGLNGSLDQAAKAGAAGDKIMMMINYDMIAYLASAAARPWYVNIIYYDNSLVLRDEATALCSANSSLIPYSDNTSYNRSDSYSFFLNGFPALFFHQSDIESTYHTTGDVTSVCNFDYCREITRASCALVIDRNF